MTDLEASFDYHWRVLGGPALEEEVRFHPRRQWRADRAHRQARVMIEIEGGPGKSGKSRHTSYYTGYTEDCVKYNAAQEIGWLVFRVTLPMLRDAPAKHLQPIMRVIERRSRE